MSEKMSIKVVNEHGTVLVSADKIGISDGKIAMSGNLMGTMPGNFFITPLELYKATKMIDFSFVKGAARMLWEGRKEFKAQQSKEIAGAKALANS